MEERAKGSQWSYCLLPHARRRGRGEREEDGRRSKCEEV